MSRLGDFFSIVRRRNRAQARAGAGFTFSEGELPGWATGTGIYEAIGQLSGANVETWRPAGTPSDGEPLPKRMPTWTTRQGEEVTIGDLVALSVLNTRDAKGRIVGAAGDGLVECVLGDHDDPNRTRPRLHVYEENLLMLLRKGRR